jgi:hypothetical protein
MKSFQNAVRVWIGTMLAAGTLFAGPGEVRAQTIDFGSADDPREVLQHVWWRRENAVHVMGGASLIGPQWRAATNVGLSFIGRSFTGQLDGTFRLGVLGEYGADVDETYDVLRLVDFIRYNPPLTSSVHLRLGPIERVQLGTGHLVNLFNSNTAWDDRTVGVELGAEGPLLSLRMFTDNVLLDGMTAGRIGIRPVHSTADARARSLEVGFSYATDLATWRGGHERLSAYNVDLSFAAARSGEVRFTPFASFAWYDHYGSGLGLGADLESPRFLDLARFRLRMSLFYNGSEFIPGYIGSFYTVNNQRARIVNSVDYLERDRTIDPVGSLLEHGVGGSDLVTEFRLLLFERFEFWYFFRRHYGDLPLSEYHLRLFMNAAERFRVDLGLDRGGLTGFFSLFRKLNDQTALVFNVDYHVGGNLWVFLRSRYTFERVFESETGVVYYLVQRRFEPLGGLKLTF